MSEDFDAPDTVSFLSLYDEISLRRPSINDTQHERNYFYELFYDLLTKRNEQLWSNQVTLDKRDDQMK